MLYSAGNVAQINTFLIFKGIPVIIGGVPLFTFYFLSFHENPYLRQNFRNSGLAYLYRLMVKYILIVFLFAGKLYAAPEQDTTSTEVRYDIFQELKEPGANGGSAHLSCSPAIDNLLHLHINQNKRNESFSGYRIQIFSRSSYGSDMAKLKQMRDDFEKAFQDIPAYLKYIDPDFKIRVGNFRTKLESIPTLYRVRKLYPSSYPVKTEITLNEMKRIPMQDIPVEETGTEGQP